MPLSAIDFYNANATNIVNVPRVDHPEDPSGIAGVRRVMEAKYFAADAPVMSLSDACQFAEAYAAASQPEAPELVEALRGMFQLVTDEILVRNIARDSESGEYCANAAKLVLGLKKAELALKKAVS